MTHWPYNAAIAIGSGAALLTLIVIVEISMRTRS